MGKKSRLKRERKSNQNEGDRKVNFSYYAVAYIDILNQKETLKKIDKFPKNEKEEKEFIENCKESLGTIKLIRSTFDNYFEAATNKPITIKKTTQEQIPILRHLTKTDIKKQQFSDSIIFYFSLADDLRLIHIKEILTLFNALSATLILCLSIGKTFRGAVEVGIGCDFFKDEIYGPVLAQAYKLENEMAKYPRVLIGQELFNFIQGECQKIGEDPVSRYTRSTAEMCKKMVCTDIDGLPILDYLGEISKLCFSSEVNLIKESLNKAFNFVNNEWNRFKIDGNDKLALRYFMLRSYIMDRQKEFWS
ncbi:MAG: hypothetical protein ACFFDT_23825 [Candidatus Hodarchaeota archaeon]